jgi:hypothetical protein
MLASSAPVAAVVLFEYLTAFATVPAIILLEKFTRNLLSF